MQTLAPFSAAPKSFVRPGFRWDAADAYLFDIDGTLLNSRDAVHYFSFRDAARQVLGIEAGIDGVPVHGNTDPGILRAALRKSGVRDDVVEENLSKIVEHMCAEVQRNHAQMRPELCPSILELVCYLRGRGKLLGAASGNLEPIGWLKLEKAGLKDLFAFGSFSFPRESRAEIFEHGIAQAREWLGPHASVTVIGDTPSDIDAAHAVGPPVIALATGIFSFAELRACEPDACFGSGADLLSFQG